MTIGRRRFIGGAGAFVGTTLGGIALADGRPPVTADQFNEMVLRNRNAQRFNCAMIRPSEEGPFYNTASPLRRNIAESYAGVPLTLRISLGNLGSSPGCSPISGAVVDIWHANAVGEYSNVGAGLQDRATPGETFMRGHQMTDATGTVEFETVVPGWEVIPAPAPFNYAARTTHIHVKIYHEWQIFDTQLYFADDLIDPLYAEVDPYRKRNVIRVPGTTQEVKRLRNGDDYGFKRSESTPMTVTREGGKLLATAAIGTWGTFNRGVPSLFGK